MNWREHIWIDPDRMHGVPCLRGTRIPVYVILENLADGETQETIMDQFPGLQSEHFRAALTFAAELAHDAVVDS